jgi:hypothetical protein
MQSSVFFRFAVSAVTLDNLRTGGLLKADADQTISDAERSAIGAR